MSVKSSNKIELLASILGAIILIYLSYPVQSKVKRFILNPFFQTIWLLIILWMYNSYNKHIAMIMAILFVAMRIFLKGEFIEKFQDKEDKEDKESIKDPKDFEKDLQIMNEETKRKLAQLQLDKSKYPLAIETILDIQGKYSTDLKDLTSQDLDVLGKYTPEQYPEKVGLPESIDKDSLNYSRLVEENKVIKF